VLTEDGGLLTGQLCGGSLGEADAQVAYMALTGDVCRVRHLGIGIVGRHHT
jgi:hypothetical protein